MNQSCLSWAPASLGVFFCIPACEPQASLGTGTRGSGAPPATRTLQTGPFTLQAVPLQPPGATMGALHHEGPTEWKCLGPRRRAQGSSRGLWLGSGVSSPSRGQ